MAQSRPDPGPGRFHRRLGHHRLCAITRGNFRLIDRLFTQVERMMKINELNTVTADVIEAARSTLVIGIRRNRQTAP